MGFFSANREVHDCAIEPFLKINTNLTNVMRQLDKVRNIGLIMR